MAVVDCVNDGNTHEMEFGRLFGFDGKADLGININRSRVAEEDGV